MQSFLPIWVLQLFTLKDFGGVNEPTRWHDWRMNPRATPGALDDTFRLDTNKLDGMPRRASGIRRWWEGCPVRSIWGPGTRETQGWVQINQYVKGCYVKGRFHSLRHSLESRTQTSGQKLPQDALQLNTVFWHAATPWQCSRPVKEGPSPSTCTRGRGEQA